MSLVSPKAQALKKKLIFKIFNQILINSTKLLTYHNFISFQKKLIKIKKILMH
jgi:hypothetical protein